jgi:predicted  nucleic acid-binding Zn-ribbon protein
MFGLIDVNLSRLEVEEGRVAERIQDLQREKDAIKRFLEQASTPPRETLRVAVESSTRDVEAGRARLAQLKTEASAAAAQEAERRREVSALIAATQGARSRLTALEAQIEERRRFEANLTLDIERHSRSQSASIALSGLEFTRCPRCLQPVTVDRTDPAHCYVCGQAEPEPEAPGRDDAEILRLKTLRSEGRELLTAAEDSRRSLEFEVELLEQQLMAQEAVLAEADAPTVAPLFDAIAAASADIAEAENRRHRGNELTRYWDELDRLEADLRELRNERAELLRQVSEVKARLEEHRRLVVEFSATFREVVVEAQLPWFEDAVIDLETYLPVINGASFNALSSGGMKAVVNVAYHLALLTEGLVERDLRVPNLLIIDSPAKNLGVSKNDRSQADRVYRRIAALAGAYQQDFQIIVADNDPPGVPLPIANRIDLSYDHPLVPGVAHPGPGVPTIGDDSDAPS